MIIIIHSSKTMRFPKKEGLTATIPQLLQKARELNSIIKILTPEEISGIMKISPELSSKTHALIQNWTDELRFQSPAIDSFSGDIYSGLQANSWTLSDRTYANERLRILSGLYGIIKPLDGIYPYRFEMGYRLKHDKYKNCYEFWGDSIVNTLPKEGNIVNLAANEYSKVITNFVERDRIITPVFLTVNKKTNISNFVVVHTKIARGAFASWMVRNRVNSVEDLKKFEDLNYKYNKSLSKPNQPVFECKDFGGLGLSVRLK